jgi:hypothetical protein
MVPWEAFAAWHPELAERGARRLLEYQDGLAFLSTPQSRGDTRVQPVYPYLEEGRLYVLRTPTILRKPKVEVREAYALQAFPMGGKKAGDFFLAGEARLIGDPKLHKELCRNVRLYGRPGDKLFELRIQWALYSGWDRAEDGGVRAVRLQWNAAYPVRPGR